MIANVSCQATLNTSSNFFIVALYDSSAPTVLLESIAPTKPVGGYPNPFQVVFTTDLISSRLYIVKLWENASAVVGGVVRCSMSMAPNQPVTVIRADEYLIVDTTPGLTSTATEYDDVSWAGWDYSLERVGTIGTMFPLGRPNVLMPDYEQKTTGGIKLLLSGDSFQIAERFVVRFLPKIGSGGAVGQPSPVFSGGEVITISQALTSSHLNKALLVQGSDTSIELSLPALSTVMDFDFLYLYSAGGTHRTCKLPASGSDKIQRNTLVDKIILGQNEIIKAFKAFGVWNIDFISPGVDMVGEFVVRHNVDGINSGTGPSNMILCNGAVLNRITEARLWEMVSTYFAGIGALVSDTSWSTTSTIKDGVTVYTNRAKFSTGDGVNTFRIPDLRDMFIRGSGDGVVGNILLDQLLTHEHDSLLVDFTGGYTFGKGPAKPVANSFTTIGSNITSLTGVPYKFNGAGIAGSIMERVGSETYPKHFKTNILIRT